MNAIHLVEKYIRKTFTSGTRILTQLETKKNITNTKRRPLDAGYHLYTKQEVLCREEQKQEKNFEGNEIPPKSKDKKTFKMLS